MTQRFDGKVAVITGGGSGIGLATAERLTQEGAKVVIVGRTKDKLEKAADELRSKAKCEVFVFSGDMSSESDVKSAMSTAVEKYGRLDAVFLNAGVGHMEAFSEASEESYNKVFDTNTKGILFGINAAAKVMKEQGTKGAILVTSSGLGHTARAGTAVMGIYSAAKAAAEMFVKYAAIEYADAGIRVNAISPGLVWTPLLSGMSEEEADKMAEPTHLMKRAGRAHEVASLAAFMLADEASLVTGANYDVDGGWQLKA